MIPPDRPGLGQRVEAAVTGLWLALWQVALAATLLRTAGATMQSFFMLTAAWLLGGVLGARAVWKARPARPWDDRQLLIATLVLGTAAKLLAAAVSFSTAATWLPLLAGALAGLYAGVFIASRASSWSDSARLLLYENNGFVLGYALAFALLLYRAPWLDAAALMLGVCLVLAPERHTALGPAAALGAVSSLYYLLCPYVGDRGFDGLMTATGLAHPDWVTLRELFLFPHPLVIPLTAPLFWLGLDPLRATAVREALCAGGVVALGYLAAGALAKTRRAGVLAAALLTLAVGRWRLATCGEVNEVAQLVGVAFLYLYLDHRGSWTLGLPRWHARSARTRRIVLAGLLALSLGVHLINATLAVVVLAELLGSSAALTRRTAARDAAWVLGGAAVLAGPFFLWLAMGPGGARSAAESAAPWTSLGTRALLLYTSARAWLLGSSANLTHLPSPVEALLATSGLVALLAPVLRSGPSAARSVLLWALVLLAHAFVAGSPNPESVAPAMTGLVILGSAGLFSDASGRWRWLRVAAATSAVLLIGRAQVSTERAASQSAGTTRMLVALPKPSPAPLADLSQLLDAELPREALLLVTERLHASYFHIYTRRRPLFTGYVNARPDAQPYGLVLNHLSQRAPVPELNSQGIDAAIAAGQPVYLLSAEPRVGLPQRELPWDGLRLYTLSPTSGTLREPR